ncbi:SufE family protein [Candidatus Falkowbacteria bacterium]|nr:SufE family protein [Candidatus Falkowbacteria bacterium]
MTLQEKMNTLRATFESFPDWELKYEYIIETGKSYPGLEASEKTEDCRLHGCQSQVWLRMTVHDNVLQVRVDADSLVAKGIATLIATLCSDVTLQEVATTDIAGFCKEIGLLSNLSPTRAHGLLSMITTIQKFASQQI